MSALASRSVRASFWSILKIFFSPSIFPMVLLMVAYVAGVAAILNQISLWSTQLLKDTSLWFLFVGAPLAFNAFGSQGRVHPFSKILLDTIKFTFVVEFLVNQYTFSLPIEFFLVAIVTSVMMVRGYASVSEEHSTVETSMTKLQGIIGLIILGLVATRVLSDIDNLLSVATFQELVLIPLFSILLVPYIYFFLLLISYERLFNALHAGTAKHSDLDLFAGMSLIMSLGFRLSRIRAFQRRYALQLAKVTSRGDVRELLKEIEE